LSKIETYFIIFANVTFFESKPNFDIESHSFLSNEDFLYFLVQEHFVDDIASLNIIDQDTLPLKHGETTKLYTTCT